MTLWKMILLLNDGIVYVFDEEKNPIDVFTVGFTDSIEDLDGNGQRIVKSYEQGFSMSGVVFYTVILSDEVDENEHGQIPVFE